MECWSAVSVIPDVHDVFLHFRRQKFIYINFFVFHPFNFIKLFCFMKMLFICVILLNINTQFISDRSYYIIHTIWSSLALIICQVLCEMLNFSLLSLLILNRILRLNKVQLRRISAKYFLDLKILNNYKIFKMCI